VHGLKTQFEPKIRVPGQVAEQIEDIVGHAIRPRCDGESDDAGKFEGFAIESFQFQRRLVGIRVALEVGNEFFRFVAFLDGDGALFELCCDRSPGTIVLRRVARVVAINTSADRDRAVAVGAGEI